MLSTFLNNLTFLGLVTFFITFLRLLVTQNPYVKYAKCPFKKPECVKSISWHCLECKVRQEWVRQLRRQFTCSCMAAAMAGTKLGGFRSRSRTCTLLYTVSGVQVQMYRCIYICTDVHMYRYRDLQMKLYLFQKKVSLIASGLRCPCPAEWAQEPGQCCKRQCCIGSAVFRLCCAVKVSAVLCAA